MPSTQPPAIPAKAFDLPEVLSLSEKQLKFITEYIITNDASNSAIAAGFKRDYGRQLTQKTHIKDAILAIKRTTREIAVNKSGIDTAWVIDKLTQTYRICQKEGNRTGELKALELLGKHTGAFNNDQSSGSTRQVVVNMQFNYQHNEMIEEKQKW